MSNLVQRLSAAADARLTTTGAGFVAQTTLVTPAWSGLFRVVGYALVDSVATMRCRLQNVTDGVQVQGTAEITPGAAGDRLPISFAGDVLFAGVAKTFALQFSDLPPPGSTAGMSFGRIHIWRVG